MGDNETGVYVGKEDAHHIAQIRELLDKAAATLDPEFGVATWGSDDRRRLANAAAIRAEYLAKLQRVSGWALRDAVASGVQNGMTWRWMGMSCQLPVGTLHRQYKAGGRIVVRDNVTQELDYTEPVESGES